MKTCRGRLMCSLLAALAGGSMVGSYGSVTAHGSADTPPAPATTTVDSSPADSIAAGARPVVQLTVQGMFPVEPPFLGNGPMTVIYDDGSVLVAFRGNFCCRPQVWPYEIGHVDPAEVEDLLATAGDVGLLAEPDPYGPTNIVDAARTTLVLGTPGGVYTHVADGLRDGDEPDPRRAALQGFIGEIVSLTESVEVGEAFYSPTRVAIVAAPIDTTPGSVVEWPDARSFWLALSRVPRSPTRLRSRRSTRRSPAPDSTKTGSRISSPPGSFRQASTADKPHAVPVWFVWDGRTIFFSTGPTTAKHRNLQREPWVIAHLGDGDDVLIVEGHTTIVHDHDELSTVDRLFRQKYVDPHSGATAGYPQSDVDVPFKIIIKRIMIWEYGAVSARSDFVPDDEAGRATLPPV